MHREQMRRLIGKVEEKGLTLVPLSLYLKGRHVKVSLALARGRSPMTAARTSSAVRRTARWPRPRGTGAQGGGVRGGLRTADCGLRIAEWGVGSPGAERGEAV